MLDFVTFEMRDADTPDLFCYPLKHKFIRIKTLKSDIATVLKIYMFVFTSLTSLIISKNSNELKVDYSLDYNKKD